MKILCVRFLAEHSLLYQNPSILFFENHLLPPFIESRCEYIAARPGAARPPKYAPIEQIRIRFCDNSIRRETIRQPSASGTLKRLPLSLGGVQVARTAFCDWVVDETACSELGNGREMDGLPRPSARRSVSSGPVWCPAGGSILLRRTRLPYPWDCRLAANPRRPCRSKVAQSSHSSRCVNPAAAKNSRSGHPVCSLSR